MCRLVSVSVDCTLGDRYISYGITHENLVLFLVGKHKQDACILTLLL